MSKDFQLNPDVDGYFFNVLVDVLSRVIENKDKGYDSCRSPKEDSSKAGSYDLLTEPFLKYFLKEIALKETTSKELTHYGLDAETVPQYSYLHLSNEKLTTDVGNIYVRDAPNHCPLGDRRQLNG